MVKKKNLFSFKSKKRKKKKKVDTISKDKKSVAKKKDYKNIFKKWKENFVKNNDEKIKNIKTFLLTIAGYGLIVNYSLHFIFGIKFNLLTLFAWGIAYYFITDEFVEWFRRLIAKR